MKLSQRLQQRARVVAEFRDAYAELTQLMERKAVGVGRSEMRAQEGQSEAVRAADARASRLAGRAVEAAKGYEQLTAVDLPGRKLVQVPLPLGWRYSLDYPFLIDPEYVVGTLQQIIGRLEEAAWLREEQERTLAGRIAAFVGFPARVRALVVTEYPSLGRAGFAVGVGGQILVGVGVTVLSTAALAGAAALWRLVF